MKVSLWKLEDGGVNVGCILAALTLDKSKAQDSPGLTINLGLSKVCVCVCVCVVNRSLRKKSERCLGIFFWCVRRDW